MNFMGQISGSSRQQQQQQQHQEEEEERRRRFDGTTGGEPSSRLSDPMDNNNDDEQQQGMMMVMEREHMFDKVVTPSDVGKLNRLVIPKQHAEKYFPLDSSTNDKGLLLNFEDRNGKPWRFRYSYWNSSQSYVMTKGWSQFVKDKKLDAGDIVSFQRGVGGSAKDRLFIDWRHRPNAPNLSFPLQQHQFFLQSQLAYSRSHSSLMLQPSSYRYRAPSGPYHNIGLGSVVNMNPSGSGSVIYFRSGHQQQLDMMQMQQRSGVGVGMGIGIYPPALPPPAQSAVVFESVPVVHGKAAAKRLRLFGVNMDCPIENDDDQEHDPTSELSPTMVSSTTSTNPTHMGIYHQDHCHPHHHHNHPQTPSSSTIPYLQLSPYGEDFESQFHQNTMMSSSSSTDAYNKTTKSSSSSHMSLDLDI